MAVNPYLYLVITNGTDTFTLADGTVNGAANDAEVTSMDLGVAQLRPNALGGRGEYTDTLVSIDLDIVGSTAQNVYNAYAKLKRLLDGADSWRMSNGKQGAAVLLKWCPVGAETSTTGSPLQSVVLVRMEGDNTQSLSIPSDYPRGGNKYRLSGVSLRFLRTGAWLHTTQSATHNSVTNGDLATLTFASGQNVASPTKIDLTNFRTSNSTVRGGYVLLSEIANGISIVNAENMATGAYTSINDASDFARNTNILRYTPTVTTRVASAATAVSTPLVARLYTVLINARTQNSLSSFLVRAKALANLTTHYTQEIPISSVNRDWYSLGLLSVAAPFSQIQLEITAASTSYYIEIDTVVLLAQDVGVGRAIKLGDSYTDTSYAVTLEINHRALTYPSPIVEFTSTQLQSYTYSDNPYISTSATTIYAALLSGEYEYWRQGSAGANNWTATRTIAYLTPT